MGKNNANRVGLELAKWTGLLRAEFWSLPPEAMVDRPTIAAAFYLSVPSMEAFATKGGGPKYIRLGRKALYKKADGLRWALATGRAVDSTAQLSQVASARLPVRLTPKKKGGVK